MKLYLYLTFALPLFLISCSNYVTPGGPADLSAITDSSIADSYKARPAAKYPTRVAVVRVQENGYRSHTEKGNGNGAYSVITSSEIEQENDFESLRGLNQVKDLVRLNSLLLPSSLQSAKDLRVAAAKLHTDMVLLYTVDTDFYSNDLSVPLSVVSLGLSPTQKYNVKSTVSAILLDTRTGFVYGAVEELAEQKGLSTGWGKAQAMDQTRLDTERAAFEKSIKSVESLFKRLR